MSESPSNGKVSSGLFFSVIAIIAAILVGVVALANSANTKADTSLNRSADNETHIQAVDSRTEAQFAEIMRSLDRLEKAQGIQK